MDHKEVYRLLDRYEKGYSSTIGAEAVLSMFYREGISLDEALIAYTEYLHEQDADKGSAIVSCGNENYAEDMVTECERLRDAKQALGARYSAFNHAQPFMLYLKRVFCKRAQETDSQCAIYTIRSKCVECPCKQFSEFVEGVACTLAGVEEDGGHLEGR